MSYRLPDERMRGIRDIARKSVIFVDNGSISRINIFCHRHWPRWNRMTRIDKMIEDHAAWPSPDSPDDSRPYGQIIVTQDIDLTEDGYDTIEVSLLDPPDGLTMSGEIVHDSVKLTIVTMCQDAMEDDLDVMFAIYATGTSTIDESELRDVVTKGRIHIVAGPIEQGE